MRRASQAERNSLGDPYRLYNEIQNVGKTFEGTKKRIRWVFGFTESNEEFEVTLTHSQISGKRTIKENGREIVSSTNMTATDFSYGWDSQFSHRLFRIEAQSNVTVENDYIFTIDGIRFQDLPPKPVGGALKRSSETNSRYGSELNHVERSSSMAKRNSDTSSAHQRGSVSNQSRPQFQSPANKSRSSDDFDPFADNHNNRSEPFDPFGSSSTTKSNSGFDPFSNTPPDNRNKSATAASHVPQKSAAKSVFDTVEDDSRHTKTSSFDAFGDSNDPFSSHPSTTSAATTHHGDFDAFGDSTTKKSTPVKGVAPPPVTAAQHRKPHTNNTSTPDFFGESTAPVSNSNQPARRASAVEISMDFAGLSFDSKPMAPEPPKMSEQPRDVPKVEEQQVTKAEEVVDPWASNLVDLDLTGRAAPQRRTSQANAGPSLNQMMGAPPQRRSSLNNNDPFGAPDILPLSNPVPPAPVAPLKPLNPSQAISSLGPPGAPYGAVPPMGMGYNAPPPMGGGYPAPNAMTGRGSMTMGGPMAGAPMGSGPMGGGMSAPMAQNTRGSFIGNVSGVTAQGYGTQPPKNSLDSLDWRA